MSVYQCAIRACANEVTLAGEVCDLCWEFRRHQLDVLPALYLAGHDELVPGNSAGGIDHVRLSRTLTTTPMSLVVYDVLEAATAKVAGWAYYVAGRANVDYGGLSRLSAGRAFREGVAILVGHDTVLATGRFAGAYVVDLYVTYCRLRSLTGALSDHRLDRPCPTCDATSVVVRHAGEYAVCLTCGGTWSEAEIRAIITRGTERAS